MISHIKIIMGATGEKVKAQKAPGVHRISGCLLSLVYQIGDQGQLLTHALFATLVSQTGNLKPNPKSQNSF
ncbi:hypothetical protein [Lentilactobacillus hilgardii]|uniref:hypothetical protein n=1 Tax=Lentilactobacillus hilgardii TaxID=1588 RepID=UPI003FA575F0